MQVPLVDLVAQQDEVSAEVRRGLDEVFKSCAFIGGPAVAKFEADYAKALDVRFCVGVASGTDAVELALRAVGVKDGGEVILPVNTFIATVEAVSRIGASPVLVDVDEAHLLIDPTRVKEAVTDRTQAVIPVHLFGQTAPVEELLSFTREAGIPVVEDAAQSHGARRRGRSAGSLGDAAATSFYPGKNLGAAGDAGAVVTDSADVSTTVRLLGAHGSAARYVHEIVGMNSRLDAIQAVVLSAKLQRLQRWNRQRRDAAARYGSLLADLAGVTLPTSKPGNEDVWHLYVIRVDDRDRVLRALNDHGVRAAVHYPVPLHLTGAYGHLGLGAGSFPVAEAAAETILSLPIYPHIAPEQQEYVAEQLAAALNG